MFKYKEPTMAHDLNDDQITTCQHGQHVKERSDCYQITKEHKGSGMDNMQAELPKSALSIVPNLI